MEDMEKSNMQGLDVKGLIIKESRVGPGNPLNIKITDNGTELKEILLKINKSD